MKSSFNQPFLPKISRPATQNCVLRPRLVQLLDAIARKSIIWLTSPGGSGKTTLVAGYLEERHYPSIWYHCDTRDADPSTFFHYLALAAHRLWPEQSGSLPLLTPEYLPGLDIFTRRYFETLYSWLRQTATGEPGEGSPFFIVFDNYQEVPVDAKLHDILVRGLEVLPPGIVIVVISRHDPPPLFSRLRANNHLALIGWEEMRFTLEETTEVINSGRARDLPMEMIRDVHAKAEGWIAAIVLLLERQGGGVEDRQVGARVSEGVFDYFAAEIFSKSSEELQDFLLKTAFLPIVSVDQAEELTGKGDAGGILATLNRQNYFTERLLSTGRDYRYHPLFRDFLLARARAEINPVELVRLVGRAARILLESNRIEDTLSLLMEIGDWDTIGRLLLEYAHEFIMEGRYQTLSGYLDPLPEAILSTSPRLLYWQGLCRLPFAAETSRSLLERSFQLANEAGDRQGALLAWTAIVDSLITEHNDYTKMDDWISWLVELNVDPTTLPPEIAAELTAYMLFSLTFRQPGHPHIKVWAKSAEDLLRKTTDLAAAMIIVARLLLHYTFFGEIRQAEILLKHTRIPDSGPLGLRPLALIQWQVINAIYAALGSGNFAECLAAVEQGLALSREHGIPHFEPMFFYYGAIGAALSGDLAESDRYLAGMAGLRITFNEMHLAYYLSALAWRDLLQGDTRSAAERIGMILPVTDKLGHVVNTLANHVGLAQALFEQGERDAAREWLARGRQRITTASHWFEHAILVSEAYFAFREGREEEGLERAALALALGRESGVSVYVYWRPEVAGLVCTRALAAGIESDYVRSLIRRQRLRPDPASPVPADWPWPLKVETMGGFRVLRDGAPLEFSRKTPQKPLELLKVLVAAGGSEVPVESLTEILWPEADGDLALKSFETTLARLRKILGVKHCLIYSGRQLSLDPQLCRVDSLALAVLSAQARTASDESLPALFRQAEALYRGPFLPGDTACAWTVGRGEFLKNRFLDLAAAVGRVHERRGEWRAAADCYRSGLILDELTEEFYRRIFICSAKLGQRAEIVQLYQQCCRRLADRLGITPSPETESLYRSLIAAA